MTFRELAEKIDKLSEEQKDMSVKGWLEFTPILDAVFCIENEDFLYNPDVFDRCYRRSELEEEDIEKDGTYVVLEANHPFLWFD